MYIAHVCHTVNEILASISSYLPKNVSTNVNLFETRDNVHTVMTEDYYDEETLFSQKCVLHTYTHT